MGVRVFLELGIIRAKTGVLDKLGRVGHPTVEAVDGVLQGHDSQETNL